MKSLYESIFDNKEKLAQDIGLKTRVSQYLNKYYHIEGGDIKGKENDNVLDYFNIIKAGNKLILNTDNRLFIETAPDIPSITSEDFEWGNISGCNFTIYRPSKLKSLKGCPEKVKDFSVMSDILTSLEGSPKEVEECIISCNKIKNLKGMPIHTIWTVIAGNGLISLEGCGDCRERLNIESTSLTNLKGAPKICGILDCSDIPNITSLEGSPKVLRELICSNTGITNLIGGPEECQVLDCKKCKNLVSTKGCPQKVNILKFSYCTSLKDLTDLPKTYKKISMVRCPAESLL